MCCDLQIPLREGTKNPKDCPYSRHGLGTGRVGLGVTLRAEPVPLGETGGARDGEGQREPFPFGETGGRERGSLCPSPAPPVSPRGTGSARRVTRSLSGQTRFRSSRDCSSSLVREIVVMCHLCTDVRTVDKPACGGLPQAVTQRIVQDHLRVIAARHCGEEQDFI